VGFRPCKDEPPQAEACATIAALAQWGAARNLVDLAYCGEPRGAAERATEPLAEASRWVDSEAQRVRARASEGAVIHSPR
jgi:hypothetical protein